MKRSLIYHVVMDDGTKLDLSADSAASAISLALRQHAGHRAVKCYWGGHSFHLGLEDAYINYDIPPHDPLPVVRSVLHKPEPVTDSMFNDAQIAQESADALKRRDGK